MIISKVIKLFKIKFANLVGKIKIWLQKLLYYLILKCSTLKEGTLSWNERYFMFIQILVCLKHSWAWNILVRAENIYYCRSIALSSLKIVPVGIWQIIFPRYDLLIILYNALACSQITLYDEFYYWWRLISSIKQLLRHSLK